MTDPVFRVIPSSGYVECEGCKADSALQITPRGSRISMWLCRRCAELLAEALGK